jgi:8-oxo-dGTP pyrophosphatase MutT (NUDIX family)
VILEHSEATTRWFRRLTLEKSMSREGILKELGAYRVKYPEEAATVNRFMEFVSNNEACFERSLANGHVTGSAWVVDNSGKKVLLTHHRKLDRWLQLGGHADGESDILKVAMREVQEESGIDEVHPLTGGIFDLDIHLIPEFGNERAHTHYDIRYALRITGSEVYTVSDESHDLGWIPIEDISSVTKEESMHRMARKWIAQNPHSR